MSADILQTERSLQDRREMITQADILSRLVAIQDKLYRIEEMQRVLEAHLVVLEAYQVTAPQPQERPLN